MDRHHACKVLKEQRSKVVRETSVSVSLSVSLFNGSWVGCYTFFLPYSQCWRRRLIHVCIQKVYLRGKHFIIHSLWNQWLIVFSLSEAWSTSWLQTSTCGGREGRSTEGEERSGKQQKSEHLQAAGLDIFTLRILPILHLREKMGKRPDPEWLAHVQAVSHSARKFCHYRHTLSFCEGKKKTSSL